MLFLTAMTVSAQDAAPRQGGGRGGPPKNLKVLTPETERPMMMAMRGALGQQCNFCHIQGDNASDENPKKLAARKMMEMVNDINAKFPDGKVHVSCYTCHRGKTTPDMAPPPPTPPAAQ
jgi:photosynthetic reaction center cytochrome c subunit